MAEGFKIGSGYVEVTIDDRTAEGLASIESKLQDLHGTVRVSADTEDANARVDELRAHLDDLGAHTARPRADLDDAAARARIDELMARLDELGSRRVRPDVDDSGIRGVGSSANNAKSQMSGLIAAAISLAPALVAGAGAGIGVLGALGSAAVGAVAGLAVLKLAFSGISTAYQALTTQQAQAGATAAQTAAQNASAANSIVSAQEAVGNAVQAVGDAQRNAATSSEQAAQTVQNAQQSLQDAVRASGLAAQQSAQAVSNAQQSLQDAFRNSALSAQQSSEQVANAERGVADATQAAAQSIQSALQQQVQAENSLTNAQMSERSAQQALTDARAAAANQLENLTLQTEDGALAQRSAILAVQQAQLTLGQVQQNPASTQLQIAQAQLALDQANQQVTDITEKNRQLAQQKAEADAQGVSGATSVVGATNSLIQAQESLSQAQQGVANANQNVTNVQQANAEKLMVANQTLADAQRAQANSQITNTEAVQKAEQSLADAENNQANSAISNAESVQKAEQSLANAREQQANTQINNAESIQKAQQSVGDAQRALAQAQLQANAQQQQAFSATKAAMAALGPAGQQFVRFLVSDMKPALDTLRNDAEQGVLPGLETGLKTLTAQDFPLFRDIVQKTGSALGTMLQQGLTALTDPFWKSWFGWVADTAGPTITTLGHIFGNIFTGMAGILKGFGGTWTEFGGWLDGLSQKFAAWGKSIAAGNNKGFNDFLKFVHDNGPKVAQILGEVATTLGKTAQGVSGLGSAELSALDFFLNLLSGLPPGVDGVLAGVAGSLLLLNKVGVLTPMAKALDGLIGRLTGTGGLVEALGGATAAWGLLGAAAVPVAAAAFISSDQGRFRDDPTAIKPGTKPVDPLSVNDYVQQGNAGLSSLGGAIGQGFQGNFSGSGSISDWATKQSDLLNKQLGNMGNSPAGQMVKKIGAQWNSDIANIGNSPGGKLVNSIGQQWNSDWANIGSSPAGHVASAVGGWFSDASSNAQHFMGDLSSGVGSKANEATTSIGGWFGALPGNVGNWFSTTAGNAGSQMGSLASDVGGKAGNAWQNVSGWFGHLGGDAGNWFGDASRNAGTWMGNLGTDVGGKASTAWHDISGWFGHLGSDVGGWFSSAASSAGTFFGQMRDNVSGIAGTLYHNVLNWIGTLRTDIGNIWDDLAGWTGRAWGNIQNAAATPARFVVNTVYDQGILPLWNDVASVFGLGQLQPVHFAGGGVLPGYAPGQDTVPAMLSPGEAVLTPEAVRQVGAGNILALNAQASGRSPGSAAEGFAGGGIVGDFVAALTDPVGAVKNLFNGVLGQGASTPGNSQFRNAVSDVPIKFVNSVIDKAKGLASSLFSSGGGAAAGGGVTRWAPDILQALSMLGQPAGLLASVERRMNQESGGNPTIVNTTDSNWQRGTPSVGLMQVIGPTFDTWAGPFRNTGPFEYGTSVNPLANIYAGLNYAEHAYPSLQYAMDKSGGYDSGGLANSAGFLAKQTVSPERVLSPAQTAAFESAMSTGFSGDHGQQILDALERIGQYAGVNVYVTQTSGSPAETGRFVALGLRSM